MTRPIPPLAMKRGFTAALLAITALSLAGCDEAPTKTAVAPTKTEVTQSPKPAQAEAAKSFDAAVAAYDRQDYATALRIFRELAAQGHARAQWQLGVEYVQGRDVPQDYKEAARLYGLAAVQGHADAQYNLGVMYGKGQGVAQDYKEAVRLWGLAAAQGHARAQNNLGTMYEVGTGVAQDYVRAHMWFNLRAVSDDSKSASAKRDEVAAKMTPAQIAEAQKLAAEWKPKN